MRHLLHLALLFGAGAGWAASFPLIKVCANEAELPPFTFIERHHGTPTGKITGATVDLFERIAHKQGWRYQVELLPWPRCLAYIHSGRFQVALDVGGVQASRNEYLSTPAYYQTHPLYFYSQRRRQEAPRITTLRDLKHYRLCGLQGYLYEGYGLRSEEVDTGARSYSQLIAKLHLNRCDLFIEKREVIAGLYLIEPTVNKLLKEPDLLFQALPDSNGNSLHMIVSRQWPDSERFWRELSEGIQTGLKNKEMDGLLERYLP
ncbi:substrate-binding periplasmic protein [Chitinimonas lacunae]|uniref:Substrate-binding periplasmic protein n=1 Tax=Chitinimonas lacunae TaxID=1963018 RepID=A0ABV8MI90_9NEIS